MVDQKKQRQRQKRGRREIVAALAWDYDERQRTNRNVAAQALKLSDPLHVGRMVAPSNAA